MDFLPYKINFKDVYAGFWPRFAAGFIDFLILMPLIYLSFYINRQNLTGAILLSVPIALSFIFFHAFFNARFGATPGKMALKIKIVKPDGTAIGWSEALKRQAVDIGFNAMSVGVQLWGFLHMDSALYDSATWPEQTAMMKEFRPSWFYIITIVQLLWMLTDIIVFFSNKRRRAAHDFIGGTVVIHKAFAREKSPEMAPAEPAG